MPRHWATRPYEAHHRLRRRGTLVLIQPFRARGADTMTLISMMSMLMGGALVGWITRNAFEQA